MADKTALGQACNIECELDQPLKMHLSTMELKSLSLMCGKNGSGKTMINKIIYFASMFTFIDLGKYSGMFADLGYTGETGEDLCQFIFDHTFINPEEISGKMTVFFENGTFSCRIEEGKVKELIATYNADVKEGTYPRYMSTATRLFTAMEPILTLFKVLPKGDILKHCMLFDLFHCLAIQNFAMTVKDLSAGLTEKLKEDGLDIASLLYDETSGKFSYVDSQNNTRPVGSLSNGHQSLLNIYLAVEI